MKKLTKFLLAIHSGIGVKIKTKIGTSINRIVVILLARFIASTPYYFSLVYYYWRIVYIIRPCRTPLILSYHPPFRTQDAERPGATALSFADVICNLLMQ